MNVLFAPIVIQEVTPFWQPIVITAGAVLFFPWTSLFYISMGLYASYQIAYSFVYGLNLPILTEFVPHNMVFAKPLKFQLTRDHAMGWAMKYTYNLSNNLNKKLKINVYQIHIFKFDFDKM